ncbi:MAG: hypothetical protein ACFCUV_11575 [Rivularia sp. (in: cyanobacteria)]
MKRFRAIKVIAVSVTISALFGFILARKNYNLSFLVHGIGCFTGIGYTLLERHEEEWNPIAEAWKEVELEREKINNQYIVDCENHATELENLRLFHEEELENYRKMHHEELNNQREQCLDENKQIIELYENELELYTEQLQLKESLLKQAKLPKLASGISRTEYYANKIINYLYSKNIECDYVDSWEESTFDLIRLIPKNGNLKQFRALGDELQLELRLNYPPQFDINLGYIQIKINTKLIETSPNKLEKPVEPSENHFQVFLEKSHQLCLTGATGDGKTVLISNIIGLFDVLLGGNSELIITNPKPSKSSLSLGKAKYLGFKHSIFGLLEAATEITYRLWLNQQAIEKGRELPNYSPKIYFFDEYSELATRWNKVNKPVFDKTISSFKSQLEPTYKQVFESEMEDFLSPNNFASELLKFIWRVGRSEKVKSLIAGQNLMPNVLGVNKIDLLNCGFINLGDTAQWALSNIYKDWSNDELLEEYKQRIAASELDEKLKYFALFKSPRSAPYFANLPDINKFPISSVVTQGNSATAYSELNQELVEDIQEDKYSDSTDSRNLFPDIPQNQEIQMWEQIKVMIANKQKKLAITEVLKLTPREYRKGLDYINYLSDKYEN